MKQLLFLLGFALVFYSTKIDSQNDNTSTASKNVQVLAKDFRIPQLSRERKVQIYLPPNYEISNQHYPVLYILDGQNIFDASTSYAGEWEVDETLNRMFRDSGFGLIVVAIDHGGSSRLNEYSAWDNSNYGSGEGEEFLDFLIETLKPEVDKIYRTKTEAENTAILGASMGGLFAHFAVFDKPDVFGKAGIFSPSFWYASQSFDFTVQAKGFKNLKLAYVIGEKEGESMIKQMEEVTDLILTKGLPKDRVKISVVPNGTHSEVLWRSQFEDAVKWLYK